MKKIIFWLLAQVSYWTSTIVKESGADAISFDKKAVGAISYPSLAGFSVRAVIKLWYE
ncbi:MAG: hypothetical protein J6Y37_10105 [Paludibacteraceae bacterium]|nr:hypothetical protein [Paludibacteraceae bacterium]